MEHNSYKEISEGDFLQYQHTDVVFESEKEAEELEANRKLDAEDESCAEDEGCAVDDVYKLDISVFVAKTQTPEADDAFDDAILKMEGKRSFNCDICSKVCKSKGGLTRHHNSKHAELTSGKRHEENVPGMALDPSTTDGFVDN